MILYPRGMGGNWLSNLIWHLEQNNTQLPQVDTVFDGQQQCSITMNHGYEKFSNDKDFRSRQPTDYLFSCGHWFHHYLNKAVKVEYHIHKIGNNTWLEQLFKLSNSARYYLFDSIYQNYYLTDIDLNYQLIFVDPEQFVTDLFLILNKHDIRYTANRDYALTSIEYYRSTCPDPADHYDNFDSILWLACCHAITLVDDLSIAETIIDLNSAQRLITPYAEHCRNRIKPMMFEWKK